MSDVEMIDEEPEEDQDLGKLLLFCSCRSCDLPLILTICQFVIIFKERQGTFHARKGTFFKNVVLHKPVPVWYSSQNTEYLFFAFFG